VVSTAASISPWTSLLGAHESYAGLGTLLSYVVLFFATRALCRGPADGRRLLAGGVVAAAVASAYAVLQFLHLDPMPWERVSAFVGYSRPFATLGHANILAAYLVTALPVVAALAARAGAARAFGPLAVLAGVAALGLTAVLLTLSRGAMLGLACAAVLLPVAAWRAGRRRDVALAGAALLGAAACAAGWLGFSGRSDLWQSAAQRAQGLADTSARREVWSAGLQVFRDHPLTGSGVDTFQLAFPPKRSAAYWHQDWNQTPTRAHNEIVHILATQGALGGAAVLLGLAGLVAAAVRAWRQAPAASRGLVVAACAGVLAFGVQSLFNFTLAPVGTLFVTLAGLLSALGRPQLSEKHRLPDDCGRGFGALLGLAALAGLLPVAVNTAQDAGAAAWCLCGGVLAATAGAAVWAAVRSCQTGGSFLTTDNWPLTTARTTAVRAVVVAVVLLLVMKWVVEPYRAALACRAGDEALAAGDSAVEDCQRAAALAPHQEVYWVKLAAAAQADARRAGSPEERGRLLGVARRAADEALRLAPSSAVDHVNLGGLLAEMAAHGPADADEAVAELDQAAAADPNNAYLLANAGQSALLAGRPDSAERYFTRGLASDPNYARLIAGLGRVALARRRFPEAVTLLERAEAAEWHAESEAEYDNLQSLAFAYLGIGYIDPSANLARVVVAKRPDRPEPRLLLARACELLGRTAEALAEYRRALALAPDDKAARNGVRRLEMSLGGQVPPR
jgi:O-antigen ligase/tetratricopeptide (TPR) repeat protein